MHPARRTLDRRVFLAGSAAVAGAFTLPRDSRAAVLLQAPGPLVLLVDPRHRPAPAGLDAWLASATEVVELGGDPVRLWTGTRGRLLRDHRARLVGFTTWPDLLVFRGLAAETRRHLRHEHQDATTGTFSWLIA